MSNTTKTVAWPDGVTWTVDARTFDRVTERLEALRAAIWGLDPILNRWAALASAGARIAVDDFARVEGDRAIFTAALARAVEDARQVQPTRDPDDPAAWADFLTRLSELHELFVTDITKR